MWALVKKAGDISTLKKDAMSSSSTWFNVLQKENAAMWKQGTVTLRSEVTISLVHKCDKDQAHSLSRKSQSNNLWTARTYGKMRGGTDTSRFYGIN